MSETARPRKRRRWLWFIDLIGVIVLLFFLNLFLQHFWAHQDAPFTVDYPMADLSGVLAQSALSDEDYDLIFQQTGLARPAVDDLLIYGEAGIQRILTTQECFFAPQTSQCRTLIAGRFTCEDLLIDQNGDPASAVPLAPLEPGDVILTFSTHTFGWRHGHAGLVVDSQNAITLEAIQLFSDSCQQYAQHWGSYTNFMVLRIKDADDQTRQEVADFALQYLDGIPYHLVSGLMGAWKAPPPQSPYLSAQCAYLPWYAWQQFGYDIDSDGGRIVTVLDLAESPLFEVVQVYGMDPRTVPHP